MTIPTPLLDRAANNTADLEHNQPGTRSQDFAKAEMPRQEDSKLQAPRDEVGIPISLGTVRISHARLNPFVYIAN